MPDNGFPYYEHFCATDCRILYYEQAEANGVLVGEVRLWDPAKGTTITLERGDPDRLLER